MRFRGGAGQVAVRQYYDAYMRSPWWRQRRRAWADAQPEPTRIRCVVCHRAWSLRDDLHHVGYERLGAELDADLVPLHRSCHDLVHVLLRTPAYRGLSRRSANTLLLAAFRRTGRRDGAST